MTLDLTQLNNESDVQNKLKEKLKSKLIERKEPIKPIKKKQNNNLIPNVDYIPTTDGIFISKLDYILDKEIDDGYIFRKIRPSEIKEKENEIRNSLREQIIQRLRMERDVDGN